MYTDSKQTYNKSFIYSHEAVREILSDIHLTLPESLNKIVKRYTKYQKSPRKPAPNAYALKGLTGIVNHDPTKQVMPAYSFSSRDRFKKLKKEEKEKDTDCNETSRKLSPKLKPGFTIPKDSKKSSIPADPTPAPNHYILPKTWQKCSMKRGTKGQMGNRTRYAKACNPPPNAYNIPPGSRGARFSIFSRNPYHSFYHNNIVSPASKAFSVDAAYPNIKGYVMAFEEPNDAGSSTPGPATYKIECVTSNKPSTPKFSFGVKHSLYSIAPLI